MTKQAKVELLTFILLCGFIAASGYHYVMGMYLGKPWPYNTFLFFPADFFADFINPVKEIGLPSQPGGVCGYPPFARLFFYVFHAVPRFLGLAALLGVFTVYYGKKILCHIATDGGAFRRAAALLVFSFLIYPFLFVLDRANTECLVFILLFYAAERLADGRRSGADALGAAAAFKLVPAACFPLALAAGGWRAAARALAAFTVLTAASFSVLAVVYSMPPGELWRALLGGMAGYNSGYVSQAVGFIDAHSLFGLIQAFFISFSGWFWNWTPQLISSFFLPYFFFAFAAFAAGTLYVARYEREWWKKVAVCVLMMNLLPYVSSDYKLLHLVIPLCFFVNARPAKNDLAYTLLFGLLLTPKSYVLPGQLIAGIVVNPLLMCAMAALIVREGLRR